MNTMEKTTRQETNSNENQQQYINKAQDQLVKTQTHRRQPRDYGRIFREWNTPAKWYQAAPGARSIYFYDPQYQRNLQQQSKIITRNNSPVRTPVSIRTRSASRDKHPTGDYTKRHEK
ncbi:unnamed protein product [Adineta steineri]|uniref:Uncharacterized protein n=1 Tax=Adineta steineri TaxID=433720 RepID=A0A813Z011_9BILA|nr:unnamed protein product [Adineta steineri]CAF0892152.1 unnamed protein product [Adineta steineri]CAF1082942.1 unnamed protein product [Adineta steineri]CAF1107456.1 unnamed protein product [Adineta steineri]CAF1311458.1 unnamed protein product [Adineta steineri]